MREDIKQKAVIAPREAALGTSLRGYVYTTYDELIDAFGNPPYGVSRDKKVDVEWVIRLKHSNVIFTIYNYKDGPAYRGPDYRVEDIREWQIGGWEGISEVFQFLREETSFGVRRQ